MFMFRTSLNKQLGKQRYETALNLTKRNAFKFLQELKQIVNICYKMYVYSIIHILTDSAVHCQSNKPLTASQLQWHTDMWFNYGIIDSQIDSSGALNTLRLVVRYTNTKQTV
jgi:hypothetical protein